MEGAKIPVFTVYSKPNCAPCSQTKKFMERNNIPFETKDIVADQAAFDEFSTLGVQTVPVITNGTETILGFNPMRIKALAASGVK